ncbi:MAG: ATP phosphoribosyltransferase regulatory subunit [Bacillota bacterium]
MNTNSPKGMKSYLPESTFEIKEIKENIEDVFARWGYKEIMTPLMEYYDILINGVGEKNKQELYKLIDREGDVLALKSEMTAPIARTVANRISEINFPLRYSYFSSVYRYNQDQQGKNREIYQMGVELIGDKKITADAETLILAVEAIKGSGINDFEMDIGHVKYLEGVFSEFNLDNKEREKIKSYLNKRNVVGLRKYLNKFENNKVLEELLLLRGGEEIFSQVKDLTDNKLILKAIENLKEVYDFLEDYGVSKYINFDLSLIRGFNYYTGIVFEAFSKSLGYLICGGGRYDNLIEKFSNKKIPAIGFALGIDRIRLAIKNEKIEFQEKDGKKLVLFQKKNRKSALKYLRNLHYQGDQAVMYMVNDDEIDKLKNNKSIKNYILQNFSGKKVNKIISFLNNKSELPEVIEIGGK